MPIIHLDEDHMNELDAVFDDFSRGMSEYSILEQFVEEPTYTAELEQKHLLVVKNIVENAIVQDGEYSSSLLNEILSKVNSALGLPDEHFQMSGPNGDGEEKEDLPYGQLERVMHGYESEYDEDVDTPPPVRGTPAESWPPVQFDNPSKTMVSLWFDKNRFPTAAKAKKWLRDHEQKSSGHYETDGFWAFPQMSEARERKYRGKIRSKYISKGVLLKFVPARFL